MLEKIKQYFCKHPNIEHIVSPYHIEEGRYCPDCDLEIGRFFIIKKVKENYKKNYPDYLDGKEQIQKISKRLQELYEAEIKNKNSKENNYP